MRLRAAHFVVGNQLRAARPDFECRTEVADIAHRLGGRARSIWRRAKGSCIQARHVI